MIKKQNNSNRGEKIASAVQKHVAEILRDDYADDPVLSRVSVVGTDSAGGLQFARIWYQVMDNYSPLGG
ncbi:MAG: ribosome-binding factor A, partial [Proteobacteria bacterium]|nr:ribosome-binding factor A [Pseudomonadota bacterium]